MPIPGRVVEKDCLGVWIEFKGNNCGTCSQACGAKQATKIYLPMRLEGEISVSVSRSNLLWMLLNTLLVPLFGFVLGAVVGNQAGMSELMTFVFSLVGLVTGIYLCRIYALDRLNVREV